MLHGKKLFDTVEATTDDAFWWLGQHSFIIKLDGIVFLVDPFITPSPERLVPPLFSPEDAACVSAVCCTHDHLDHLDPLAVSGLSSTIQAMFIAPRVHRNRLLSLSVSENRLLLLDDLETVDLHGVRFTGIKAAHETFECTADGLHPYLGFVIEGAGKVIYHAGDTVWWEGLQSRLAAWKFDVAMVPINGRDAARLSNNIIGNMTYQEAADLLGGLEVNLTVPTHYGMFEFNTVDVQLFVDYMQVKYPQRKVWAGEPTERVTF